MSKSDKDKDLRHPARWTDPRLGKPKRIVKKTDSRRASEILRSIKEDTIEFSFGNISQGIKNLFGKMFKRGEKEKNG